MAISSNQFYEESQYAAPPRKLTSTPTRKNVGMAGKPINYLSRSVDYKQTLCNRLSTISNNDLNGFKQKNKLNAFNKRCNLSQSISPNSRKTKQTKLSYSKENKFDFPKSDLTSSSRLAPTSSRSLFNSDEKENNEAIKKIGFGQHHETTSSQLSPLRHAANISPNNVKATMCTTATSDRNEVIRSNNFHTNPLLSANTSSSSNVKSNMTATIVDCARGTVRLSYNDNSNNENINNEQDLNTTSVLADRRNVNITAVSHHQDATAILGNIFQTPEKKLTLLEKMPQGLINLGNTCYLNATIQSVFTLNFFMDDLEKIHHKLREHYLNSRQLVDLNEQMPLMNALVRLYKSYKVLNNSAQIESSVSALKTIIGEKVNSEYKSNAQQDACEFFAIFTEALSNEIERNSANVSLPLVNPIVRYFEHKIVQKHGCRYCGKIVSTHEIKSTCMILQATSDHSLQTAFEKHLESEESTVQQCPTCSVKLTISKHFHELPKVLVFQLCRYLECNIKDTSPVDAPHELILPGQYLQTNHLPSPLPTPYKANLQKTNQLQQQNTKKSFVKRLNFDDCFSGPEPLIESTVVASNESMSADAEIDENSKLNATSHENIVNSVTDDNLSNSPNSPNTIVLADQMKNEKYQLVSIINHHGEQLNLGHYTAFVYNFPHSRWFSCDDQKINELADSNVSQSCSVSSYCYFYVHLSSKG